LRQYLISLLVFFVDVIFHSLARADISQARSYLVAFEPGHLIDSQGTNLKELLVRAKYLDSHAELSGLNLLEL